MGFRFSEWRDLPTVARLHLILAFAVAIWPVGSLSAQVPAIPGAPALPGGPIPAVPGGAGAAGAATPAAGGAGTSNIWSFFMKTPAQKAQIQACICGSPIGQFLNNMLMPVSLMSGGLVGSICPSPSAANAADLAKPASSAQGAAAKIKAEEAQAKAKIAALEYLATVDCRYYPEAEAAMISGLRAEKNECVRIAAAKALASGCCCSAKVVKALMICVDCSTKDGFPAEASELVRAYAFVALDRCLRKCVQTDSETPPEPPAAAKKAVYETLAPAGSQPEYTVAILLAGYYSPDSTETTASVYASARQTLARGLQLSPRAATRLAGPRNVRDSVFPGSGRFLSATQAVPAQQMEPTPEPRQFVAAGSEPIDPVQVLPIPAAQPAEKKPSRGNLLNILQDAIKR
jgi:hypothetical protein